MTALYITIGILVVLNIVVIKIYLTLGKSLPPIPDDDADYYDKDGNHIYYDRKLIARIKQKGL